jgi:hypothetical protein
MGCHGIDPVASALDLPAPRTVQAETSPVNPDTGPAWSVIRYEFPGTAYTAPQFDMVWYDGGRRPPRDLLPSDRHAQWLNGVLFLGDQGTLVVDYENMPELHPVEKFRDFKIQIEPEDNHYLQWTEACKDHGHTSTPFSYAGPLTEMVLLGNVATRLGQTIEWDAVELTAKGLPQADALIRRAYRSGWDVPGLS